MTTESIREIPHFLLFESLPILVDRSIALEAARWIGGCMRLMSIRCLQAPADAVGEGSPA